MNVLCFVESWLNESTKDLVNFNRYNDYHSLRESKRGGGVSIYVQNKFKSKILSEHSVVTDVIESLFVELQVSSTRILIGAIYRPPNSDPSQFISAIINLLTSLNIRNYKDLILCGDFNLDFLVYHDNIHVRDFINTLQSFSLIPLISKPTRVTDLSQTLIDNICMTNPDNILSGILYTDFSDHFPLFMIHRSILVCPAIMESVRVKYRRVGVVGMDGVLHDLIDHNFDAIYDGDVDVGTNLLCDTIQNYFVKHCPVVDRQISYKDSIKPWINSTLKIELKKRAKYFILYRRGLMSSQFYKQYRNNVTNNLRRAKKKYYQDLFDRYRKDLKKTWHSINNILKPKKKINSVKSIYVNNELITDNLSISNYMNYFFSNIGSSIADSIGHSSTDFKTYLSGNYPNSMYSLPTSDLEIKNIIMSLKNGSCITNFSAKILKHVVNVISPLLTSIINRSMLTGIFPSCLKLARVIPIYKGGDRTCLSNYRPISILPVVSKIFERVMYSRLYSYLHHRNVLTTY